MTAPALVLAAGFGTRLRGHAALPKPLVHFRGRRLVEWNLVWLAASGVERVWLNLHHEPEAFRAALGAGAAYGLTLSYSEEPEILGTAGGWRRLRSVWDRSSLVVYGDNVMRFDLQRLLEAHSMQCARRTLCTVALFDTAVHAHTGIAGGRAALSADGLITSFREGAAAGPALVNAGVYVVEPELADWVGDGFQDFGRDVFPRLAREGRLQGYVMEPEGFCLGVDTPECLAIAEALADAGRVRL